MASYLTECKCPCQHILKFRMTKDKIESNLELCDDCISANVHAVTLLTNQLHIKQVNLLSKLKEKN